MSSKTIEDVEVVTDVKTELVRVVEASGVKPDKGKQVTEALGTFFAKAAEWETMVNSIEITSPDETGKMKMAREGRLFLRNLRLDGEKLVKANRDEIKYAMADTVLLDKLWLRSGQIMEAVYKNLETKLEEKENFKERWDAAQVEKLRAKRLSEVQDLGFSANMGVDLGEVDEVMFQNIKAGLIATMEENKRIEADRLLKEKEEREAAAKLVEENNRLRKEAEEKEKAAAAEQLKMRKEAEEREKAAAAEQMKLRKEMLAVEELRNKRNAEMTPYISFIRDYKGMLDMDEKKYAKGFASVKKIADIQLKLQEEEKVAIAKQKAELEALAKDKRDREEAAAALELERAELERKALSAPKKEKLSSWIDNLVLRAPIGLEEDKVVIELLDKFDGYKRWAKGVVENSK